MYRNPPPPYQGRWQSAPVPGWFANPVVAGPRRVGVGQMAFTPASMEAFRRRQAVARAGELPAEGGFPWIYVIAGVAVLGAGAAYAYTQGWI